MKHYSEVDAQKQLPSWTYSNKGIEKDFTFPDFSIAFAFMTRVALLAETANHHPDWSNGYNKVHIRLYTHSEQALTDKDIQLAMQIDRLLA